MSIFQLQAKDTLAQINNVGALNCLQNLNWDSALNPNKLGQLGDVNYDATMIQPEVSGSFEARATGSVSAMLSRMIYKLNVTSGEFEGYLGTDNDQTVTEIDLERAVFDLIESKKANEVFDRATIIPRAHLSQFSLNVSVDGPATESYNFEADVLETYRKPQHDMISIPVTRKTGDEDTTVEVPSEYTVELSSTVATADWKVKWLDVDGIRIDPADLVLTSGATPHTDMDELALSAGVQSAGVTLPLGARLALVVYKKVPGTWPTITYPTTARFVKADQVDLFLVDPAQTFTVGGQTSTVAAHIAAGRDINAINFAIADLWLRVQSVGFTVNLNREQLKQIRKNDNGTAVYARSATYPLNVTISISALETDLNDWAKMQGKNVYGSTTPDVLNLSDFENKQFMVVRRDYKKGTTLQTVGCLNATVDSMGQRVQVKGKSEVQWSMSGSSFVSKGANV